MKKIVLGLVLLTLISCRSGSQSGGESAKASGSWPGQMQNMAQDVRKLLPYVYDKEAFRDPKNRPIVQQYLKDFAAGAHQVRPETGKGFIGDDLLLEYSLANLQEDLNRASYSYQIGQVEYARTVMKSSMSHCFRCHSVTPVGAAAKWDLDDLQSLQLKPLEKADLLVATRKYDKALSYMEGLLNSPEFAKAYAFDYESLLRRYMALIIRIENAPQRALTELEKILERGDTPHYLAEQAQGWRQSLKTWAREAKKDVKTSRDLFAEVERRFKRAEAIQHYEKDHAGDVEYLRATALLHEGMKIVKSPRDQARALYLLGKAYEVLDELGSWNLHESYYEACLLKDPKSATAKRCYNRLEASLFMGYSGSAGTHLPPEERERLRRLKEKIQ